MQLLKSEITKRCSKCKEIKNIFLFGAHKLKRDGIRSQCKACVNTCNAIYRAKYPEKSNEWQKKEWSRVRNYKLKANFGIGIKEFNKMFAEQNGCCAICKRHQNELSRSLAVDHCHNTNKIRKLLCGNCNTAIGLLKHDTSYIKSALEYLTESIDAIAK